MNEKATFSNQKHKQELVGLNSIQICHFSRAVFVQLRFYRQGMGRGRKSNTDIFAVRLPTKGERERENTAVFCLIQRRAMFKIHFTVTEVNKSKYMILKYVQKISSMWNFNSELNV